MKHRLLISSIVLLIVSLILVACGGPAATTAPTSAPATTAPAATTAPGAKGVIKVEDNATLVFSGWGDESEQKVYKDSIVRFNKLYPNVKVDYQPIPQDFQTKLKAAMVGGTAADVFYVDHQLMAAFGRTGQILPVDSYMAEAGIKREDFIPALLALSTLDGKTYALPKDWGTLGLVYLPEAFKAANIAEPTASWKWDDLKKAAEAINATGKYKGFCQGADVNRFLVWALSNGATLTSDDFKTAKIDSPEMKAAAKYVLDMKKSKALVAASDVGAGWCGEAIGKKLVGMTYEGGWMVNFMRTSFKDVEWKAVALPDGSKGKADVIFTNGIGINAKTKFPRAAAAFAIFVTSRDNQGEIVKTGFAYSSHPDQLNLVQDANDKAISQGANYPITHIEFWGPNTGKINDAVSKMLERLYKEDQTLDEAVTQTQKDVQALLQ